ncbi:MAG: hypothetical protein KF881_14060 [Acidobacteria bacterium]|nr:hypothetical protein [Acidobacteriota bacterium]
MLKRLQKDYLPLEESWGYHWVDRPLQYYVRSTVLGGAVLSEVNNSGKKLKSYVFAGGQTIAWQALVHPEQGSPVEMLRFEHYDPAGMSRRMTIENGNATGVEGLESDAAEFDPAGQSVGLWDPYPELPPPFPGEGCIGCGSNGIMGVDDNSQIYVNGLKMRCRDTTTNQIMSCQNLLSLKAIVGDKHNEDGKVVKGDYSPWKFIPLAIVGVDPLVLRHFGVLRVPRILEGEARTRPTYLFVPKRQQRQIGADELPVAADDPCRIMAALAEEVVKVILKEWGSMPLDSNSLRTFETTFSSHYVGRSIKGWRDAIALSPAGSERNLPKRKAAGVQLGQRGFKDKFREKDEGENKDQTHHFAAFLSLGINSKSTIATIHQYSDYFNAGDFELSKEAYAIGQELVKDPTKLSEIGDTIRTRICD